MLVVSKPISETAPTSSLLRYDCIVNDRHQWGIGFAVEVYSTGDDFWYPGQIINISNALRGRTVEVIYNGKTKRLPIVSGDLRPLMNNTKVKLRLNFNEVFEKVNKLLEQHKPEQQAIGLNSFISYNQQEAQDAAGLLHVLLQHHGVNVWFDMQQEDISVGGMSRGIAMSHCFLIYLTKSYFDRVFTVFELETAIELGKPIIVVWEGDERRGGFTDFKKYIEACPDKYKVQLFQNEAIKFERRKQLREAQIRVIAERILQSHNLHGRKSSICTQCDIL